MQNLTQPLHRVQQHISLPHDRLILRVLDRGAVSLYYAVHFVDGAVETGGGYEAGEFAGRER